MNMKEEYFVDHLQELRQRIIKTLLIFIMCFLLSFLFVEDIYQWIIKDFDGQLAILGPTDILWVFMVLAGVCALAGTIPVAAFQLWKFVSPALTDEERKVTFRFIPFLFLLFIVGLSFGYFVLYPLVLKFLLSLSADYFATMFTADKYFRFMLNLTLPFGFLFEMPLVVMFLTRLGILNPIRLARARKVSYFVLVILSILITPPDIISDVLVIVPLLFLYEISITLSKVVYRKKLKEEMSVGI